MHGDGYDASARVITSADPNELSKSPLVRSFMLPSSTHCAIRSPALASLCRSRIAPPTRSNFYLADGALPDALVEIAARVIALDAGPRPAPRWRGPANSTIHRGGGAARDAALRGNGEKMNYGTVKSSFEAAAQKSGLLGTLFWWDLGNNRVHHRELVRHASEAGLDQELLPPAVKANTAFKRAWRAAARRIGDDLLLREIADTPDQLVVAVVREDPDVLNLDLRYAVLARATFSKKTERIAALEPHPILDALPALFDYFSATTTEDIRTMVLAFVKKSGLSIRHAGGVYFIPPTLSPTLEALCAVLRVVGSNTIWTLPVADLGDASATLGVLARETLDAEVTAVEAELAAFDARDVQTRDSTLERRLNKFEEIRGRANLMAGALSFRADSLHEKLASLESEVRRRLFGDTPLLETAAPLTTEAFDADVGF